LTASVQLGAAHFLSVPHLALWQSESARQSTPSAQGPQIPPQSTPVSSASFCRLVQLSGNITSGGASRPPSGCPELPAEPSARTELSAAPWAGASSSDEPHPGPRASTRIAQKKLRRARLDLFIGSDFVEGNAT
jgi:hypothetical protein